MSKPGYAPRGWLDYAAMAALVVLVLSFAGIAYQCRWLYHCEVTAGPRGALHVELLSPR